MPSQRKRIGFLPSEEVQEIIDKLCRANEYSQSKVTGLLVEEALRSRGVLSDSFTSISDNKESFINYSIEEKPISKNDKPPFGSEAYRINKKEFSENLKMMHEFIEFKYFKKVMMKNNVSFD